MPDERTLAFFHQLERADEEVAATLAELDELAGQVEAIRSRAGELEAFRAQLPGERERLAGALAAAERQAASARDELADADDELADAEHGGDERAAVAARHRSVRARDAAQIAERRVAEATADQARLESEAGAVERDEVELGERARRLARVLHKRPRLAEQAGAEPARGAASIANWASGAGFALFVARGLLAAEREALIRQANELAAVVLGEPVLAPSAAEVARRVRRAV